MASVGAYAWKISAAVRIPAVSIERGPGPVSRMKRLASVERFSFSTTSPLWVFRSSSRYVLDANPRSKVNWVPLKEKDHKAILAVIMTPQKRIFGKQMQPQMASAIIDQPKDSAEPSRPESVGKGEAPSEDEMVEKVDDFGDAEMVSSEEEPAPHLKSHQWRAWSPSRVRAYFTCNPHGVTEGRQTCLACGVSRMLTRKWYLSKKTGRPAGSWCKTCKIKRHMERRERRRSQDVD